MTSRLWIHTILILTDVVIVRVTSYDNFTIWNKGNDINDLDNVISNDKYFLDASKSCRTGSLYGCLQAGTGSVMLHLMQSIQGNADDDGGHVKLVKTKLLKKSSPVQNGRNNNQQNDFLGFLKRASDTFLRTTGLVLDLNDEVTENGAYRPRFIDEIYSEIDTLEDKNAKPNKRYEFKKLFIPLLVILKIFKLKLLIFLPVLLGLASFKKIIALLMIILPAIIGYFKICKPDLGHTYGSYGHSSFYNSPPSAKRKQYQEFMEHSFLNDEEYAHQMAYQAYKNG